MRSAAATTPSTDLIPRYFTSKVNLAYFGPSFDGKLVPFCLGLCFHNYDLTVGGRGGGGGEGWGRNE